MKEYLGSGGCEGMILNRAGDKDKKREVCEIFFFSAIILFYCVSMTVMTGGTCFLKGVFGIPCPGCGATRAMILLAKGDIAQSLDMNPSAPILFFCIINEIRVNYFKKGRKKTAAVLLTAGIIASFVIYIIRMRIYFPLREPYVFNRRALLFQFLRFLWV